MEESTQTQNSHYQSPRNRRKQRKPIPYIGAGRKKEGKWKSKLFRGKKATPPHSKLNEMSWKEYLVILKTFYNKKFKSQQQKWTETKEEEKPRVNQILENEEKDKIIPVMKEKITRCPRENKFK